MNITIVVVTIVVTMVCRFYAVPPPGSLPFARPRSRDSTRRLRRHVVAGGIPWSGPCAVCQWPPACTLLALARRSRDGASDTVYRLACALCLTARRGVCSRSTTIWGNFRDETGLLRDAQRARRRGFTGKLAIHPVQVATINAALTPNDDELAWSRRAVDVFECNPGLGTIGLDGKMLDMPP